MTTSAGVGQALNAQPVAVRRRIRQFGTSWPQVFVGLEMVEESLVALRN
jgi:hypothetical protein